MGRTYEYIYFYYNEDGKRVPILTGGSRYLHEIFSIKEKQSTINEFPIIKELSIENELFVWIDGTEFLV